MNIKGIKGDPYDYQREGVEFLLNSGGRALLADSPGVGKSLQALGYVTHSGFQRNIIVCPASVKFSWENEINKWTDLKSYVVGPKTDLTEVPFDVHFIIINFDILKKFHNEFKKYKWNSMVVDECVIPQTYISTNKGQKQIVDLVPGEQILTYNIKKEIYEYKPLVRIIKRKTDKKLTQVNNLICTEDHKIFDGEKFVEAKKVKKTMGVGFLPLKTGTSDEVLAGCLMGDASLKKNKEGNTNARLIVGNCLKNEDYIKMKCDVIEFLDLSRLKKIWNQGYKPSWYFRVISLTNKKLTNIHQLTYKKGKRIVDISILDMMGSAGLAIWIQDDGSCVSGMIRLNTQRYGLEENKKIARWFQQKYDITTRIGKERKKDGREFFYLSFYVKDSLKIYSLIRDYVVPSMRYKFVSLESRFNKIHTNKCRVCKQRIPGLHNTSQNVVNRRVVCDSCKIQHKKKIKNKNFVYEKPYDYVYDLEIKDNHNFFADGILVHNCHMIKNQNAIRSKMVKSLSYDIPNIIMLTGTPVLSRPIEMFNMLNIIDKKTWNNYYSFAVRYCEGRQGYWGFEAKGANNLEELNNRISKYFLRRTKEDVLKELPSKNRIKVPVDLPKEIDAEYRLAEKSLLAYFKEYKEDKTNEEIEKSLVAEKLVKLNLLREINARGKIKAAEELIESIIDAGEKVLVFSSFNEPLKELANKYSKNSVLLLGETNAEERGPIVKEFQENPDVKIFFGGTQSAGVGITLTAASNVVFLDYPWNPADLEQSENRAHRPGAEYQSLNIYTIATKNTIDGFMEKLLNKKQDIINQVIEGDVKKVSKDMINTYLKELKLKYK